MPAKKSFDPLHPKGPFKGKTVGIETYDGGPFSKFPKGTHKVHLQTEDWQAIYYINPEEVTTWCRTPPFTFRTEGKLGNGHWERVTDPEAIKLVKEEARKFLRRHGIPIPTDCL